MCIRDRVYPTDDAIRDIWESTSICVADSTYPADGLSHEQQRPDQDEDDVLGLPRLNHMESITASKNRGDSIARLSRNNDNIFL